MNIFENRILTKIQVYILRIEPKSEYGQFCGKNLNFGQNSTFKNVHILIFGQFQ